MRAMRALPLVLAFCGAAAAADLAAQTRTLNGRVVSLDRKPVEGIRLRLVGLGDPVVLRSGEFSYDIPAGTDAVTVQVRDTALAVVYPVDGRLPVPAGDERVTIVVGEPVTTTITRALAERQRESERLLEEWGVQREALGGIEQGIASILTKLDLREADLRDEVRRKEEQAAAFPEMSRIVEHYLHEAADFHTHLSLFRPLLEENPRAAFQAIKVAVDEYNPAYEEVRMKRAGLETTVERLWQEGALARRDLADVFNTIERLHREHIEPLNGTLLPIQSVLIRGARRDDAFRAHLDELDRALAAFQRTLEPARSEALRTLEQLRPR